MPTGYTAGVADGTITDFTQYALQCARAFGACIMLRDEPLSSEIPVFEPSDYHAKELAKAEQDLSQFLAMDEHHRRELHAEEHAKNVETADRGIAEKQEQLARYNAMLERALQFKSPSPEHDNYAKFIVSQLEESISFDCGGSYYSELKQPIEFEAWESKRIQGLYQKIEYHRNAHRDEVKRTESRNRWVRQLKEALSKVG